MADLEDTPVAIVPLNKQGDVVELYLRSGDQGIRVDLRLTRTRRHGLGRDQGFGLRIDRVDGLIAGLQAAKVAADREGLA